MPNSLLLVESPHKAKTIASFLGKDYDVIASVGHITDLSKKGQFSLGINLDTFKAHYVLLSDKVQVLTDIMKLAKKAKIIYLASDNDREGNAIAWHLSERLKDLNVPMKRVVFSEIKKSTILKAIQNAGEIDMNQVHSQEARRMLDRIVGFMASPFLADFYGPKLSAGRVQSVVTKMIIEREEDISKFIPEDFWTINVSLTDGKTSFITKYPGKLIDQKTADSVKDKLTNAKEYIVSSVVVQEEKRNPPAPLITSTLQQIMSRKSVPSDRTMAAAQKLYESGYITYLRTDSVRSSDESISDVRDYIKSNYDLPKKANVYTNKGDSSQDAHECLRPVDINLLPSKIQVSGDEQEVYEIIWQYFVASQMMPAIYNTLKVTAHVKGDSASEVKASGKALKYKGFLEVLGVNDDSKIDIPMLSKGDTLKLSNNNSVKMDKKQTQPPARYAEDKLIKELDNKGIGRPSTYADLLSKITTRNYVEKKGNVYHGTDLGKKITNSLNEYFTFMNYDFTALLEKQLDEIALGNINHIDVLKEFYHKFIAEISKAYIGMGGILCKGCNSPTVKRINKQGKEYLLCRNYPTCKIFN